LNDVTQGIATEPILAKLDPTISFKDIDPMFPEQKEREKRGLNDLKQTIKRYSEELRNNPNDEENIKPKLALAHYECGMLYQEQGKNDMALIDYEKAVNLEPANSSYRECLALIYYNRGYKEQKEYKEAIADLNEAIKLEPTNSLYHKTLESVKKDRKELVIIFVVLVGFISAIIGLIIGAIVGSVIGAIAVTILKGSVIGLVGGIILGIFWGLVGNRNLPGESKRI
jgi:tetratricopeptide (TPR) repeat protein